METRTALTALAEQSAKSLPKHNAAGEPLRTWTKVVNGHKVQARITGWDGESDPIFWVDGSSESLTINAAELAVA